MLLQAVKEQDAWPGVLVSMEGWAKVGHPGETSFIAELVFLESGVAHTQVWR